MVAFAALLCGGKAVDCHELFQECSEGQARACEAALCELGLRDRDRLEFRPLTEGWSPASLYTLTVEEQKYVLRFSDPSQSQELRQQEARAFKVAGELEIGRASCRERV